MGAINPRVAQAKVTTQTVGDKRLLNQRHATKLNYLVSHEYKEDTNTVCDTRVPNTKADLAAYIANLTPEYINELLERSKILDYSLIPVGKLVEYLSIKQERKNLVKKEKELLKAAKEGLSRKQLESLPYFIGVAYVRKVFGKKNWDGLALEMTRSERMEALGLED